ncbi:MAG: hypothetical protein IPM26_09150 [Saprospiraceae bacterium]|nr:hypothetical protein [Saprospiraceae bacterium]
MKNFRNSKLAKFIAAFLAIAVFNLSCSSDQFSVISNCESELFNFEGEGNIPDKFERALELANTINNIDTPSSYHEYHTILFGDSNQSLSYVNTFDSEAKKYSNMGFENYLTDVVNRNLMSNDFKAHFMNFSSSLNTLLSTPNTELPQFLSFINNQRSLLENSSLCLRDKNAFSKYLDIAQGYGQFMFKKYEQINTSLRGCNFLEAIGCGLLALIVGAVVTVVTGVIILMATVTIHNQDGTKSTLDDKNKENFAIFVGFALGIYAGISVYKWCCNSTDGPTQRCSDPTGAFYTSLGCNDFRYTVFGPSNYGTTQWNNINTNPSSIITSTPSLRFSVPEPNYFSDMHAMITCLSSGSSLHLFPWDEKNISFAYNSTAPTIQWSYAPPNTAVLNTPYNISVSTTGNGLVTWTVSPFGGIVMSTGSNSGNLIFWTPGI